MSEPTVKIKLNQTEAGKLYMKALKLEEQNRVMRKTLLEASDYLDTSDQTSIGHGSILHRKFREVIS